MSLRRSDRIRRLTAISDFDIGDEADPTSFKEAMKSQNSNKWREAMLNELESMKNNQRDRARGLGLSQKTYIKRILKRFDMSICSGQKIPLAKGDLKNEYCPKNKEEEDEMRNKSYASLVGSIMYA
ncbi:hypothetical protein L3X38_036692 [Prunus dulcis]|uniref:Retrovirus-related Pol polyprotein from transposon TNT 1-94 n=1 Tax=Prunus dulcis TaxID=3755 RepID=A0AAD4V1X3_PRUDU|nr:hypothetical protein L3X38_036692 [Prunus dulcis]